MAAYEFKVLTIGFASEPELNRLGAEGWRVVATLIDSQQIAGSAYDLPVLVFSSAVILEREKP